MEFLNIFKRYCISALSFSFLLLYLLLPTVNNTIDAWGFASYVKQGENLFLSHHLFYNALGFLWIKLIGLFVNADTLKLLIILNALFAAATLYLLGKTLKLFGVEGMRLIIWVVFAGSTWAIMRFATENETYIVPLLFSMLGSFFFTKSSKGGNTKNYFYSGIFSAIACLFHQVMFFWWLSLLIGIAVRKKIKPIVWYALPALVVPLGYIIVIGLYYNQSLAFDSIMHFVFRDYFSGAAGVSIGASCFMLTAISMVRTFLQVHGYFLFLHHYSSIFIISGIVSIILLIIGLFSIKRTHWIWSRVKEQTVWVHLLAIGLQLTFAFLSNGNAEFMVMIPILLVIVLSQVIQNEARFIGYISVGMLIWNVSLGLIPLYRYPLDSNINISAKVLESQLQQKKQLFVLFNKPGVENKVKYHTGEYPKNIISGTQDSINHIKQRINQALAGDTIVLTDCINRPKTLSRETLVVSKDCNSLFTDFIATKVDSIETLSGRYFLYSISNSQE